MAISSAPPDYPSLAVQEIGHWPLVCALPQGRALATDRTLPLAQALRQRLIAYSPEAPQTAVIDAWLAQHAIDRQVAVEVRSGYAACSMAAAGIGVASVDDLSARAHRPEDLVFKPVPLSPRFPIYGLTNVHRPVSALGQAFLAMAASALTAIQAELLR